MFSVDIDICCKDEGTVHKCVAHYDIFGFECWKQARALGRYSGIEISINPFS